MMSMRERALFLPRVLSGIPEITKSAFFIFLRSISKSRFSADFVITSTRSSMPAFVRLCRLSRASVGLISKARIFALGHFLASLLVRAPLPAPSSMISPWYVAGMGAIIFSIRTLCEGMMPPVCAGFAMPAQIKRRYVLRVWVIGFSMLMPQNAGEDKRIFCSCLLAFGGRAEFEFLSVLALGEEVREAGWQSRPHPPCVTLPAGHRP